MNPQLSRRVALIMMSAAVQALTLDEHLAFVDEVSKADSFDSLPIWVQDVIVNGESQMAKSPA